MDAWSLLPETAFHLELIVKVPYSGKDTAWKAVMEHGMLALGHILDSPGIWSEPMIHLNYLATRKHLQAGLPSALISLLPIMTPGNMDVCWDHRLTLTVPGAYQGKKENAAPIWNQFKESLWHFLFKPSPAFLELNPHHIVNIWCIYLHSFSRVSHPKQSSINCIPFFWGLFSSTVKPSGIFQASCFSHGLSTLLIMNI